MSLVDTSEGESSPATGAVVPDGTGNGGDGGQGDPRTRLGRLGGFLGRRNVIAWGVFFVALIVYVIFLGIPYSTDDFLIWITAALFCACISDLERWRRGLIRDWIPLYLVLALYSLLRGFAGNPLFAAHWSPELSFDTWIGFGQPLTVRLQNALFNPNNLHVWDYLAWCTYMSHFFTSFVIAAVLWVRDHQRFRRFVPLFVGLTLAGYITYVLYPAMPPWMVSSFGYMPPTARIIPVMWNHVGLHGAAALFEGNSTFDNNIAAVPSLHSAYPTLICLFFWGRAKPWLRVILVAYVLAMAFTLVYTGEHFVFDILLGWAYAITTFVVGSKILDWWRARRQARAVRVGEGTPSGVPVPAGTSAGPEAAGALAGATTTAAAIPDRG